MIETLRIEGMAVVDSAELEFGPGLNVLTGETGAGKSIVLGALSLLAGARGSLQLIRDGRDETSVEAVFDTARLPELESELAAAGIDPDDHQLVVRRSVARSGRGRARLAGQLVPVATLAETFTGRLEISSQHDSQSLLRPEVHGRLLDRMGGLSPLRDAVARGYSAVRALDAERDALQRDAAERARRRDYLAFQVEEIDAAGLDPGDVAALRNRRSRLAHAGRLQEEGARAVAALAGDSADDGRCAVDLVSDAARRVAELRELDPTLVEASERLNGLLEELRDTGYELDRHFSGIEANPAELASADARLHQIENLQRKYGATVEEVLATRERAALDLAADEGADDRESEIAEERKSAIADLTRSAKRLSKGRRKAAGELARAVQENLRELGMPDGEFAVALDPAEPKGDLPCGPNGAEIPEFRFSANPGSAPRSLRAVVSGGELSRVFLSLKQALREADAGMVLVFDEVDAGIGGRAADRVGRKLAELAAHHQVLCITHLPQIAAFASTHFRVSKRAAPAGAHTPASPGWRATSAS